MNKTIKKAIAASAVCAVAFAGGVTTDATAASNAPAAKAKAKGITKYAYKANVVGTKVVLNGVELRTVRDAQAAQPCTRKLRGEKVKGSALGTDGVLPLPDEIKDIIRISPSTSRTKTYRQGNTYGVLGKNTIADIKIGGAIPGTEFELPKLTIDGLVSNANSFNKNGKFGHEESFSFQGIGLDIEETDLPQEVKDLLDIIDNQALVPVNETVNQVVQLLVDNLGIIEIPGLGSIELGKTYGKANKRQAVSNAYALKITVINPQDDSKTILQLGRATSSIHAGATGGVFRSTMSALDLQLGDLVRFSGVSPQNIPCAGTNGKVRTKKVAAASVLGLVNLSGVKYSYMGKQLPKKRVKGFVKTEIASATIPAAQIEIQGITSKVRMVSKKPNTRVQRRAKSSFGTITVAGETISLAPGESHAFDGGVIKNRILKKNDFYGVEVRALQIQLFEENVTLTLAQSAGRVFFK